MQTFQLFMKLVKRNIPSVIIYFIIFMVIAVMSGENGGEGTIKIYQDEAIPFTVLNRDGSRLGEEIKNSLSKNNIYVEEEDNLEVLQNDMYYRKIYYVLIIPEGFEQSVREGREMPLANYKVEGSAMGYYMDLSVDAYLSSLKAYIAAGVPFDSALEKAKAVMEVEADITIQQEQSQVKKGGWFYYSQYLPYIFLAMLINSLGSILVAFNQEKVRQRTACSSLSLFKKNMQIALGTGVFGIATWLIFELMAIILYHDSASLVQHLAVGLNSFCFIILTVSISVMCGLLAKKAAVLSAVSVILSLGFSFLGGVFVPLSILGSNILKISKFTPTYWYVTVNDAIVKMDSFSSAAFQPVWTGMGMQLLFAAAFFSAAMAASKYKNVK